MSWPRRSLRGMQGYLNTSVQLRHLQFPLFSVVVFWYKFSSPVQWNSWAAISWGPQCRFAARHSRTYQMLFSVWLLVGGTTQANTANTSHQAGTANTSHQALRVSALLIYLSSKKSLNNNCKNNLKIIALSALRWIHDLLILSACRLQHGFFQNEYTVSRPPAYS